MNAPLHTAIDPLAMAGAVNPLAQRGREYSRQRTMTLGDLLLENRIVFIGSSPETGGSPVITDYLANLTIQKLLFLGLLLAPLAAAVFVPGRGRRLHGLRRRA